MIAFLRTSYLFLIAGLGALFMSALTLSLRRRWRHRRVRRVLEEFMHDFHLSREEALSYIAKERATQLVCDELLARGRALAPGEVFFKTTSPEVAHYFSLTGFIVQHRDGEAYTITRPSGGARPCLKRAVN
jgi:hypothetical protein